MPKKPKPKISAWSFSRKKDYDTCALRAKYKYIDRIQEPPNKAMDRGSQIHTTAEDYVKGKGSVDVPETLETFEEEFIALRKNRKNVETEIEIAFDKDWQPCGWFDSEAWCRVKADALEILSTGQKEGLEARCIDYKTGKARPEHADQMELYALAVLLAKPEVFTVRVELWYLDLGELSTGLYTRKQAKSLLPKWNKAVKPMMADRVFKARPSNFCRWCYYSTQKGGPCDY